MGDFSVLRLMLRPVGGVDADAQLIFNAFTTPPSEDRKTIINTCVLALKSSGIWTQLDLLYMTAAADSQAALINWKSPGAFTLTAVNSPSFSADRGYTGNGTTNYLDTGWDPTNNGVNYIRDSASIWAWCLTNLQNSGSVMGVSAAPRVKLCPRSAVDLFQARINDNTDKSVGSITSSIGFWGITRRASNSRMSWTNGVEVGTADTTASTGITSVDQYILGTNTGTFHPAQIGIAAWGAALTGLEAAFDTAVRTYMTSVGAA